MIGRQDCLLLQSCPCLQAHPVSFPTGEFVDANEELLQSMPPPLVALQYYKGDDLYM